MQGVPKKRRLECKLCREIKRKVHSKVCIDCARALPSNIDLSNSERKILKALLKHYGVDLEGEVILANDVLREKILLLNDKSDSIIGYRRLKAIAGRTKLRKEYKKALDYYNRCLTLIRKGITKQSDFEVKHLMGKIKELSKKVGDITPEAVKPIGEDIVRIQELAAVQEEVRTIKCKNCGAPIVLEKKKLFCLSCGKPVV